MKNKTYILILFLSVYLFRVHAQERFDIGVKVGQAERTMPWTGGYNAPQFSNIDLNRDGITDMISFDRQGDILIPYIHLPASGRWIVDWSYKSIFPKLVDWVLVVDYNHDGVEDLFTSSSETGIAGISVYKGSYDNGQWAFVLQHDRDRDYLQISVQNFLTNLYVSWDDIPAVSDIDGDGDIDILAYEPGGSYINYYLNQSMENGWGSDSIRYKLDDLCWGKILENELNQEVYLSNNPDVCSDGHFTGEDPVVPRHSGSTTMALDIDADGDKDIFIGDISSRHIVFGLNGLNAQASWIVDQDATFPSQDTVIDLPYFLGTFSVQLDDDPEPELLVAVNSRALTEDRKSVWRYDDDPSPGPLNYKLTEKGVFQNQMIDLGSNSRPAVSDIDGDGLEDLLIGGYHYTDGPTTRIPSIWYFRNTGTLHSPYFELLTDDFLNMSQFAGFPTFDFAPAFGDIDGNGTLDLIVGEQNGKLFFYRNNSPQGQPMSFDPPVYPYMNISVGVSSAPQIADINGDGLGDLVIGERTGNADQNGRCSNLNYFENLGTTGNAVFNSDLNSPPNTACYGRVLFDLQPGLPQYSAPYIFVSKDGVELMAGGDPGKLNLYGDLEAGKTGSLTVIETEYGGFEFGNRSSPALADLDHDGKFELLAGNQRGGVELFHTDLLVGTTAIVQPSDHPDKPYQIMYSNAENIVEVVWKNGVPGKIELYDAIGRVLNIDVDQAEIIQAINLEPFPMGIYFVRLQLGNKTWVEKIVDNK
ncbi:MAG: T9SS type A sorting domain-containing protein [Saprospiraceae bacterium]|uniref:T9SS type A sorting domain-containing protein n=1 Tax=Candidatus Opimibacter skivensis TaxID=2982028 RepID=A0A9D7XUU0_9BACT|nr:T9SS type A sorting domain-containing protein [Candidatus Opimibacter skivensis]